MKTIKVGIFGANRGYDNAKSIMLNDAEIVAICDKKEDLLKRAQDKIPGVKVFTDFDEFIKEDFDVLYLANYFPEHTKYAIKALEKDVSVICECTSNGTMAEGVALVRAAEKSKGIYMIAENYPFMLPNREISKVYKGGTLGKVMFGEGEYNHPVAPTDVGFMKKYYDSEKHWRCYLPATYYITHSLGPLMYATHATPKRVTAMPVYTPERSNAISSKQTGDGAAIITILNDDDSVFRVTGCASFGFHENSYRLACENGQIESVRGDNKVMLCYNEWNVPEGRERVSFYVPSDSPEQSALAKQTGHGGSDFFMFKEFFDCIREGKKPYLDEYVATTMASVGILAHRSVMKFGEPFDIPDFHKEEDRKKYENDTLTPFWSENGTVPPTMPCCSHPDYKPDPARFKLFFDTINGKV